jgi:hypothetical protein
MRGVLFVSLSVFLGCMGLTTSSTTAEVGHCAASETAYFSCPVEGGALSLCGGAGTLQYRSGPAGNPGVLLPADSSLAAFAIEQRDYPQSSATVITVSGGGRTYEVHDEIDGGGGDMGPDPASADGSWQGVLVIEDGGSADKVVCSSPPTMELEALQATLAGR